MNITLHEVFFIHNAKIPSNGEKKHEKIFGYFLERVSIDMPIIPSNFVYLQMGRRCCISTQNNIYQLYRIENVDFFRIL